MRGGSRFVPRRVEPGVLASASVVVMVVVALSATRAWEESHVARGSEELDVLATEETAEYEREGGGGGGLGVPSSRPPTSSTIPETTPAAAATTTP